MRVKPAEGRTIRDPQTMGVIPDDGSYEVSDHDLWWAQRISEGDVVLHEDPPPHVDEVEPAGHEESER